MTDDGWMDMQTQRRILSLRDWRAGQASPRSVGQASGRAGQVGHRAAHRRVSSSPGKSRPLTYSLAAAGVRPSQLTGIISLGRTRLIVEADGRRRTLAQGHPGQHPTA